MIGLVSAVPQLVWVSEHKTWLFAFAGVMLLVSGISQYVARNAACPIDPGQARACMRLRKVSRTVFCASLLIYLVGFYFAFATVIFPQN